MTENPEPVLTGLCPGL